MKCWQKNLKEQQIQSKQHTEEWKLNSKESVLVKKDGEQQHQKKKWSLEKEDMLEMKRREMR